MSTQLVATKWYIPRLRPQSVLRPHLLDRLSQGRHRKLTLLSAPAGFGKSTLLSAWVSQIQEPVAWLSLDEGDRDPSRFFQYLLAALQSANPDVGSVVLGMLQSPQPLPIESILTALLNDIATFPQDFVLILDDYHTLDHPQIDEALRFLLQHQPPQMHLVLATREDPQLPLARLRAQGQLTELRAADLRFRTDESTAFLNQVMGLNLTKEDVAALEGRTEGWIAGLQLAAISMQGQEEKYPFIKSFTGSHHFVMDYLVGEVVEQQPAELQHFLLHTSLLKRLCGPLCDALLAQPTGTSQETLAHLERSNLFLIPMDNERRWYRYHHLFAELLRQRLQQSRGALAEASTESADNTDQIALLHRRACLWFQDNGLELEAFHHAIASQDIDLAAHIAGGEGMPLLFRGAVTPVIAWLRSLPHHELNARPALWLMYASALLSVGQLTSVEPTLVAAEAAITGPESDENIRDLLGHIAAIRATMAVTQYQVDTIMTQSQRALDYLHPNNLPVRTATTWTLGVAHYFMGDRIAAIQAYSDAITSSKKIGHMIILVAATIGLANSQEQSNQLQQAAQNYQEILQLTGNSPQPIVCEAHLGLARIHYEWNDLPTAHVHGEKSLQLAKLLENTDRSAASELFLARLAMAQGHTHRANALVESAKQCMERQQMDHRTPQLLEIQVPLYLQQGRIEDAAALAHTHQQPRAIARVQLAQGRPDLALDTLAPYQTQMDAKQWQDEQLKVAVLQAIAFDAADDKESASVRLKDALHMAAPGGYIRLFLDEGPSMQKLLSQLLVTPQDAYLHTLQKNAKAPTLPTTQQPTHQPANQTTNQPENQTTGQPTQPIPDNPYEALTAREQDILKLIAQGLSNHQICKELHLALSTVKGHNQRIFAKLQVRRRTEAVARARELNLLSFP